MLVPLTEGGWGTWSGPDNDNDDDDDVAEAPPTTPAVAMATVAGVVRPFLVVFANRVMKAFLKEDEKYKKN